MNEIISLLGAIQNNGGTLAAVLYLAIELRILRRDHERHERIFHGVK